MNTFRADLHVHTVLSPCANIEMLPPLIIAEAMSLGINLIAITDHNATANISSVQKSALQSNITVLPGMELQTKEEVHVICLFDTLDQVRELQKLVDQKLPPIKNNPDYFGTQLVVDENGDFIEIEERLLITSADVSIEEAFLKVQELEGILVPAHINRKANGLIEILGFVPSDLPFPALEISRHVSPEIAYEKFPQIKGYNLIQNGDVHRLNEFIGTTYFTIEKPVIKEIKQALQNINGRSFYVSRK